MALTCGACGHSQAWAPTQPGVLFSSSPARFPGFIAFGGPSDPYFRLPLWLRKGCCGETLWAYNEAHLEWLGKYVGATLRERERGEHGWSNRSMASRLPRWMQSAGNRDELLRCIQALRERL